MLKVQVMADSLRSIAARKCTKKSRHSDPICEILQVEPAGYIEEEKELCAVVKSEAINEVHRIHRKSIG